MRSMSKQRAPKVLRDTYPRCPGCGRYYGDLGEIVANGGDVYGLGLALMARCSCGHSWGVNGYWKCTRREVSENGKTKTYQVPG